MASAGRHGGAAREANGAAAMENGNGVHAAAAAGAAAAAEKAEEAIDLRSDTVTRPTKAMREAMAAAEVDDDVLGEDPTMARLQGEVAAMLGKEAALFVPSGTMANLIAVLVHCEIRSSEVILGSECHIHHYEQGGIAQLGGVHHRTVATNPDGTLDLTEVKSKIRQSDQHYPLTRLICMENTHNRCGGRAVSVEYTNKLGELAHQHGLALHIDGARIMNAAVALDVSPASLVEAADSVAMCLSKGLAAPVGSLIVGSKAFIMKAKRVRKVLGGGMRQSGILAAAGLHSISTMRTRLDEDHRNARTLAEGLATMRGVLLDPKTIQTNIVYANLTSELGMPPNEFLEKLKDAGVLVLVNGDTIRLVTHYEISHDDVVRALSAFKSIIH